jgi:hypothetical protein
MSRRIVIALGGSAVLGVVSAAAPTAAERTTSAADEELRSLEQQWVDAEIRRDPVALRRILDSKFIATFGANPPLDRDAFIHSIVSGKASHVSQTLSDSTVVIDHDTGIVAGVDTVSGEANGAPYSHVYRYTATYVRRGGHWVALAEHMVRVPESR